MGTNRTLRSAIAAIIAILLLAPPALADTCCANLPVRLDPRSAMPGDTVRLIGLECRNADNSGPLPLKLGAFWLWPGKRAAEGQPDVVPGPGLPADLPSTARWLPFATLPPPTAGRGDATIIVPDLPDGTYQLWWWCDDGTGPGGGIHYSTGPRLAIGVPPDTAIDRGGPVGAWGAPGWRAGLIVSVGLVAFVLFLLFPYPRRSPVARTPRGRR